MTFSSVVTSVTEENVTKKVKSRQARETVELGWRHSSLSTIEFEVVTAEDGEEGYTVFRDHMPRIDIVITDLMMPKLSGTELWKRIKKERPEVPVGVFCLSPRKGIVGILRRPNRPQKPCVAKVVSFAIHTHPLDSMAFPCCKSLTQNLRLLR